MPLKETEYEQRDGRDLHGNADGVETTVGLSRRGLVEGHPCGDQGSDGEGMLIRKAGVRALPRKFPVIAGGVDGLMLALAVLWTKRATTNAPPDVANPASGVPVRSVSMRRRPNRSRPVHREQQGGDDLRHQDREHGAVDQHDGHGADEDYQAVPVAAVRARLGHLRHGHRRIVASRDGRTGGSRKGSAVRGRRLGYRR